MKRRASSAPLFTKCPAAAHGQDDEVVIALGDDAGAFGSAVHEACACIVKGEEFNTGEILHRYGFGEKERPRFMYLVGVAWRWWSRFGDEFQADNGTLRVLDFKTTRLKDVIYDPQCMEYLHLGCLSWFGQGLLVEENLIDGDDSGHPDAMFLPTGGVQQCRYYIIFLDDESHVISGLISPKEVYDAHNRYVERIENWDGRTYNGPTMCKYCPRIAACPGRRSALASTVSAVTGGDWKTMLSGMTPDQKVLFYEKARAVSSQLDDACKEIKQDATQNGGVLKGKEKSLVRSEITKKTLDPEKTFAIAKQYLTDAELALAVRITQGVLKSAIAAKAPPRQGAKMIREFMEDLEEADAIRESIQYRYSLVPAQGAANESQIEGDS